MATVDNLDIQISANATNANRSLENLITTVTRLQSSFSGVNTSILTNTTASNQAATATNRLANTQQKAGRVAKTSSVSFAGLASIFGTIYANCFLAIRGIKALGNSIKSTADYIEAYNYFDVALGKIGEESKANFTEELGKELGIRTAEEYANSFSKRLSENLSTMSGIQLQIGKDGKGVLASTGIKNLGLNIQEVTQYASQLASVTNSVGQTGEVSLVAAEAFTKLGADMSSLFNMDYSQVMTNLQSALIGQSRSVYKYGIDITNATLQTYAYNLGIEKSVSEMTQAEKMQLRMIAILEQSKVSWGDLSNTIQSPSNQLRIFSNNVEEIQLVLGQLFIPVIQRILPLVNGLSVAFKNLLVNIAGMLNIELDLNSFGQGYSETEEEINDIADGFEGATNAVKEWKNQVMGFDEVNPLKDNSAPTDTSGLKEQLNLTEQITDMADEYLKAWQKAYDKMEDKTNEIAKKFEKLFEPVKNFANLFKFGLDTDFKSIGENFMQMTFTNPNRMLQDFIHKIHWNKLGWDIGQFITGSVVESFKAFGETGTTISEAIIGINNFLTNLTNGIEWDVLTIEFINGFTDFLNNLQIGDIIDSFTDTIIAVNDSIIKITKAIIDNPEDFTELFLTLVTKIAELFIAIVNSNINIIANLLGSTFLTLFEDSIDTATGLLKNTDTVLDFLDDTFEDGAESWGNGTFPQFLADKITNIVGGSIGNAKNNLTGIGEMFKPISEEINRSFNNLSEIGDKIGDSLKDAKIRFRNNWRDIINWFRNSAIVEWWETVRDNFSAQNWTENLSGIRSGFETAFETAIDTIQLLWNDLAEWINDALNFDFAGFNKEFNVFGTLYEVGIPNFSVSLGSLPLFNTFANGGFPEDGWFRASHGEYFGKFDNGQSFIANNNQITGGIAESVYPAVFNAVTDAMSMNGNNGEIIVQIDGRNVFRAMQTQANNYTMRTGKNPF